jgi:SRSO17 transposase
METKRNIANIGRKTDVPTQNMHHFMSNSPWSGEGLVSKVRADVAAQDEFQNGTMLLLDESADDKSGTHTVGSGRQYNGRRGKVDNCIVGVFLSCVDARCQYHTWIDGELFLVADWFSEAWTERRRQAGVPDDREFQTKLELGWQMIQRVHSEGFPFVAIACDSHYGRSTWLRDQMTAAGLEYYADVPADTKVYLQPPVIGIPQNKRGKKAEKQRVLSPRAVRVDSLRLDVSSPTRHDHDMIWHTITLRPSERGMLQADFARCRVWTVRDDYRVVEEWLLIRRDGKRHTYTFSNAPRDTPLVTMAQRKSARYFIERSNQDVKTELGWDEFQAIKLRAWQHHLALTILASWFITETRLDWSHRFARDPELLAHYEVEVLPALSMANVRAMLTAAMPLPQLSPEEATYLVVKHLDNRTRSRKSRLRSGSSP